jgi:hypothetical protein
VKKVPCLFHATCFTLVSCLSYSSILKMEATFPSETPAAVQRNIRHYIPEDGTLPAPCHIPWTCQPDNDDDDVWGDLLTEYVKLSPWRHFQNSHHYIIKGTVVCYNMRNKQMVCFIWRRFASFHASVFLFFLFCCMVSRSLSLCIVKSCTWIWWITCYICKIMKSKLYLKIVNKFKLIWANEKF